MRCISPCNSRDHRVVQELAARYGNAMALTEWHQIETEGLRHCEWCTHGDLELVKRNVKVDFDAQRFSLWHDFARKIAKTSSQSIPYLHIRRNEIVITESTFA